MDDLGVNHDRIDLFWRIAKPWQFGGRYSRRALVISQPFIYHISHGGVFTDDNKNRRSTFPPFLPKLPFCFPQTSQHSNGSMSPLQHSLGLWCRMFAAPLGGSQPPWLHNPPPDIEIPWDFCARSIPDCQLGNFYQARLNSVHQAEITHHPRKGTIGLLPHSA